MSCEDEDWVNVALHDDSMVVDLLLSFRLVPPSGKQNEPPPTPPLPSQGLQLEWTVRQPRSKALFKGSKNTAKRQKKVECVGVGGSSKGGESNRASPTTPLSWSGATETSGDGFEELSSRPTNKAHDNARSKLKTATRTPGSISTVGTKRPRKKKTLAELREEECLLLKERRNLRQELANLQAHFEKERASNDRLKRLKLDLQEQHATTADMAEQHESVKAISDPKTVSLKSQESPDASAEKIKISSCLPEFLPDLNVLPDLNQLPVASELDIL